ncbi:MAG TPA: endoribonuclease MazF [Myxococcota bacterium]|nr:endoribonuclease MazF [Myxococcota bacterium]
MVNTWNPARGDIVWIDMNPQAGHEQAGRRPAVVLSPAEYNSRTGLAVMCPITCQIKGYPFEVPIPDGLPITGTVLSDQVRSLDWRRRNAAPIAALPAPSLAAILARLTALLQP